MIKYIFWAFCYIFYISKIYSQQVFVYGKINDSNQNGLNGATVVLYKSISKEILKSTFSDSLGNFELTFLPTDSISLNISYIGFADFSQMLDLTKVINSKISLGTIQLLEKSEKINEVIISSQKQFVTRKLDRIIIIPDALISNSGQNLLNVLEKSPGIILNINGNITYKGKSNFQVFINDKPSYLSGVELQNLLKSTPSSIIERIEFLNNPPAKYDAAGNSGIINIVMKKENKKGMSGGINLSFGKGKHNRSNNSINFSFLKNKFSFSTLIGYTINNSQQDLTIRRYYFDDFGQKTASFIQSSIIKPKNHGLNSRVNFDYQLDKKTAIGVALSGTSNQSERNSNNITDVTNGSGDIEKKVFAQIPMNIQFKNLGFNFNISRKLSAQRELSFNYDNLYYHTDIEQSINNEITNLINPALSNTTVLYSLLPSKIIIQSLKSDYTQNLSKDEKLEAGIKLSWIRTENIADFYDIVNGTKIPNYTFTNSFNYNENVNAAYINYSKSYANLSCQIGLRAENTIINGFQFGNPNSNDSTFKRNYTNLFPTLFLQYNLDTLGKHILGFTFGRRIDRPAYKDMNPFTYPLDNFTLYGGNPFLRPTFSYNTELTFTLNNNWSFALGYSYIKDVINETNEQKGTVWYSRPGNFDEQTEIGLSANGSLSILPNWKLQVNGSFNNVSFKSKIYDESLDAKRWYAVVSPTNIIVFKHDWIAEVSASYQSKILSGQFTIDPIWNVRMGVSKKLLKQKASVKLNVSDVFYTNQIAGEIKNITNAKASWFSYLDTRVITLSFAYQFNKGERINTWKSGSVDSEKSRVK